jgi:hypothetical protein
MSNSMPEDSNLDQKAYDKAAAALRENQRQGKERMRKRLAALSFSEKIKILEKLRDRELAIAAARLRKKVNHDDKPREGADELHK